MSISYDNFEPAYNLAEDTNWEANLLPFLQTAGVEDRGRRSALASAHKAAHDHAVGVLRPYVDGHVGKFTDHINENFDFSFEALEKHTKHIKEIRGDIEDNQAEGKALRSLIENTQVENTALRGLIEDLNNKLDEQSKMIANLKASLDKLPAEAAPAVGQARMKIPDPPTFSGDDGKMKVDDWINQISLYCSASGVVTDHQKIVAAMTRLRSPAATYMKEYFEKNTKGEDLGYWKTFEHQLTQIYGQRDTKETAKKEITTLWGNKDLAKKNFIKYCEKYRTLARLVDYEDKIHIDKLNEVIPQDLRAATVGLRITKQIPSKYEAWLDMLLELYKELNPEKATGSIFGDGNKDNGTKNDSANSSKGKGKEANSQQVVAKFCQICAGKGQTIKAKRHNTADCWDKPGNEHKRPAPRTTTSSSSTSSSKNGNTNKGNKDQRRHRLRQLLAELEDVVSDDDGAAPSAAAVNVNSASIVEIVDPTPGETPAIAQIDDAPKGPSRPTHGRNRRGRAQMDFPEGL